MLQRILAHQLKPDDLSVLLAPLLDAAFRQRQQPVHERSAIVARLCPVGVDMVEHLPAT